MLEAVRKAANLGTSTFGLPVSDVGIEGAYSFWNRRKRYVWNTVPAIMSELRVYSCNYSHWYIFAFMDIC
jgi:hypothetical protein